MPIGMHTPITNWTFGQTWAAAQQAEKGRVHQKDMQTQASATRLKEINTQIEAQKAQFDISNANDLAKIEIMKSQNKFLNQLATDKFNQSGEQFDDTHKLKEDQFHYATGADIRDYYHKVKRAKKSDEQFDLNDAFRNAGMAQKWEIHKDNLGLQQDSLDQNRIQFDQNLSYKENKDNVTNAFQEKVFGQGITAFDSAEDQRHENNRFRNDTFNREGEQFDKAFDAGQIENNLNRNAKTALAQFQQLEKAKSMPPMDVWKSPEDGDWGIGYNESLVLGSIRERQNIMIARRDQISLLRKHNASDPVVLAYDKSLKNMIKELDFRDTDKTRPRPNDINDPFTTFLGGETADSKERDELLESLLWLQGRQ
ncbi:MAG: hypothetical protein HOG49_43385 [Candidatus Scalindua sp.]|jgi:hypothetical protein|nr:hypothetical protein [Candidatus Scalindua sp.]